MAYFKCSNGSGTPGTPGADGLSILSGNTAGLPPEDGYGRTGEFFIDLDTYTMYGPKAASGTGRWANFVVLPGVDGTDGVNGTNGIDGVNGTNGIDGVNGTDGQDALWNWMGEYENGAEYNIGDVVYHPETGSSYYRSGDPLNQGWPPPDAVRWELVALKGDDGVDGVDGTRGTIIWNGLGDPAPVDLGDAGDLWYDTQNARLWGPRLGSPAPVTELYWNTYIDLKGIDGVNGTNGTNGTNGADGVDGVDGLPGKSAYDTWLDVPNVGTENDFLNSLKGADGLDGANGTAGRTILNGTVGPYTGDGVTGDFFLRTDTSVLYGPKQNGESPWANSVSLKGAQGPEGPAGEFGGALFDYEINTYTGSGTPGSGKVGFNSTVASLASVMYIHMTDANGVVVSNYLDMIDDSTSNIKGHFRIESTDNPGQYAYYAIIGMHTFGSDYYQVPVQWLAGNKNFIISEEDVALTFVRTGNRGDTGTGGVIANNGLFTSSVTQLNTTAGAGGLVTGQPRPMLVDAADVNNSGISHTVNGELVFAVAGRYNIQFSAQLHKTSGSAVTVNIWFRKNGLDIPNSDTRVDIANSASYAVPAWNYLDTFAAGDKLQIMWQSASSTVQIDAQTAGANNPAIPSVIITAHQVTYQGETGPTGEAGRTILSGPGAPATGDGVNGDFWLETTNTRLYGPKTLGAWSGYVALKGATGEAGPAGYSVYSGIMDPLGNVTPGRPGDLWLNVTTGDLFQGQGTGPFPGKPLYWTLVGNFKGPKGDTGADGAAGSDGADGVDGADGRTVHNGVADPVYSSSVHNAGDFFINTTTWTIFGPLTVVAGVGSWGTGTSLIGGGGGYVPPASWFYGDGLAADGTTLPNVVYTTNPPTLSGALVCENLTLGDGVTLNAGSHPVIVHGTLTMGEDAAIVRNGVVAANAFGGAAVSAGQYGGSAAGGNGANTTVVPASGAAGASVASWSLGGNGGGGASRQGAAGVVTRPLAGQGGLANTSNITTLSTGISPYGQTWSTSSRINGGAGGAGGGKNVHGGGTYYNGGSGGSGGGVVVVFAHKIVLLGTTATISANGGAGSAAYTAGSGAVTLNAAAGGGCGGGGGFAAVICSHAKPNGLLVQALGGEGGASLGGNASFPDGTPGQPGIARYHVWS